MATTCQICGRQFPIWIGEPLAPGECAAGGNTLCQEARDEAHGEAMRRKICPGAFDENGKILPGRIVGVLRKMERRGLNPFTGYPAREGGDE